jgi:hypothetical protein
MHAILFASPLPSYDLVMDDMTLPPELERFAAEAIAAGRYRDKADLLAAGVSRCNAKSRRVLSFSPRCLPPRRKAIATDTSPATRSRPWFARASCGASLHRYPAVRSTGLGNVRFGKIVSNEQQRARILAGKSVGKAVAVVQTCRVNAPPPLRVSFRYLEGVVFGDRHHLAPEPRDKPFHGRTHVAAADASVPAETTISSACAMISLQVSAAGSSNATAMKADVSTTIIWEGRFRHRENLGSGRHSDRARLSPGHWLERRSGWRGDPPDLAA